MLKRFFALAAFGLASLLSSIALADDIKIGSLIISAPYVRAMVPGAPVGGGYLTIANAGDSDDRLVAVSSPRAATVQIHEMKMDNDVMIMRELPDGLSIPAGKTVELKPGGYHVMFMKVAEPFLQGQIVRTTLKFEKAGAVEVDFPVGSIAANKPGADAKAGDGMPDMKGMNMNERHSTGDPQSDIPATMKAMFETPEKPLAIRPIVGHGDWAVAGWVQDGRGGRALLRKSHGGWVVRLCSGDSLKDADALQKIGLTRDDAQAIAADLSIAEAKLDARTLALLSSFEGTVMMDHADATHAGGDHAGHNK
ncbi:copper uptake system-associated protein [Rhizobium lusitanum]|uniref:Copper uptake system-associated protein n=1 Tax=Rhizobium lusitanum TaxID=293958 RepID=A0A6L9UEI5_9HYPH|nr:copper uptake system-associated protein [Rhizobium lusitanum]